MSLLLDALRKADRERRSGQPLRPFDEPPPPDNTPRAEHRAASPRPSPGSQRALLAVLWGILIAVLLLALVVWQRVPDVTVDDAQGITTATPPPMPAPQPTAETIITPVPSMPPARLAAPVLDSFDTVYSLDELAMPALQPIDATSPPSAAAVPALIVTEPAPTAPRSAFVPPLEVDASTPPPTLAPLAADVMQRRDLPAAVRDRIPNYAIDVHVYNDDPARRFILIRGERYGEGSTLEGGHRLLEIAPRGLVIDVDGQKVLIQRPG
jgi:general secretion pathway protein B